MNHDFRGTSREKQYGSQGNVMVFFPTDTKGAEDVACKQNHTKETATVL